MDAPTIDRAVVDLLDEAARRLRHEWGLAMEARDFSRVTALTDAGQAVHRALIAFEEIRIG